MNQLSKNIRCVVVPIAILLLLCSLPHFAPRVLARSRADAKTAGSSARIVGEDGSSPPVVNEKRRLRMHVEDSIGTRLAVKRWSTGSPDVATVTKKGGLKGRLYGFATITATLDSGERVAETVVVTRVTPGSGMPSTGDVKTDEAGNIYLSDPLRHVLFRSNGVSDEVFAGAAGASGHANGEGPDARFNAPTGLAIDSRAEGGLYVADTLNHCVRRVSFRGRVSDSVGAPTHSGIMHADETPATDTVFDGPQGVALIGTSLIVADTNNHALFYSDSTRGESGTVVRLAGGPGEPGLVDGQGATARFREPSGLAVSSNSLLVAVADTGNHRVRLLRLSREASGRLACCVSTVGVAGSCGSATGRSPGPSIAFTRPHSVAFDGVENVYVIDDIGASVVTRSSDGTERKVDLALRGSLGQPSGIVVTGTRVFVLDPAAARENEILKVVEVGAPTIETLSTDSDTIAGGTEVTISGSNFPPETRLTLGDQLVSDFTVVNATLIRFRVPRQSVHGLRALTVRTRGGVVQREFSIVPPPLSSLAPGEITTIAGGGIAGVGDGGQAALSTVCPEGLARDSDGTLYFADKVNNRVRRLDSQTGVITTVAGTGIPGFSGDGGPAEIAQLNAPETVALDSAGNVYIADTGNLRVRRVDKLTGTISTFVGSGIDQPSGDGGDALAAGLPGVTSLVLDSRGNLFLTEGINRIRRVDARTRIIDTIAGTGERSDSVTDIGDGGDARLAKIGVPRGLAIGPDGALYVCEGRVPRIRRIDLTTNVIKTFAFKPAPPVPGDPFPIDAEQGVVADIAFDASGILYFAHAYRIWRLDQVGTGTAVPVAGSGSRTYTGSGSPETVGMEPRDFAIDSAGNFIVADHWNASVFMIQRSEAVGFRIAGTGEHLALGIGGLSTSVSFYESPGFVARDSTGSVYVSTAFRVWRLGSDGRASVVLGTGEQGFGEEGLPGKATRIDRAAGLAVDAEGCLYVADSENGRILKILADGTTLRIAGKNVAELGDGGPALAASILRPSDIALGPSGDLFIADTGHARVRRVDLATGLISTVAGNGQSEYSGENLPATDVGMSPGGLAVDSSGDLLVADWLNGRVWRIEHSTGIATVMAGGGSGTGEDVPALSIWVRASDIHIDHRGGLLLATRQVRYVEPSSGRIRTVAGDENAPPGGDGSSARFVGLVTAGLLINPTGDIVLTDGLTNAVRVIRGPVP